MKLSTGDVGNRLRLEGTQIEITIQSTKYRNKFPNRISERPETDYDRPRLNCGVMRFFSEVRHFTAIFQSDC